MLSLLTINWNPDPELFNFFGISIRYYGLLWIIGLAFAYLIVQHQYRDRKIDEKKFEPLFFYCFFGILIGARLGHCILYDWAYYQDHFVEMILPIKQTAAGWKMTGYTGLASHGGTLGLIIALWMYCRKTKMHYMDVLDMIAVATPITACCIRLANLMNSEIIGKPTDVPWAFIFEREDMLPRHPAQLYEAIAYFIFFLGMVWLYKPSSSWGWSGYTNADRRNKRPSSKQISAPPSGNQPPCRPKPPCPITAVSSSDSA